MLSQIVGRLLGARRRVPPEAGLPPSRQAADNAADFARLNQVAPLLDTVAESVGGPNPAPAGEAIITPSQSIVSREAILGRDQRVKAYSFFLRQKINQRLRNSRAQVRRTYDEVLLRNLQVMGVQRLLGYRLAFITLSSSSLDLPVVEQLSPAGAIYVVEPDGQFDRDAGEVMARLGQLRALGYRIGLHGDVAERADLVPLLQQANFLVVDIGNSEIPRIRGQIEAARQHIPAAALVATNIPAREDFGVCSKLPFSLFQGSFITHREAWDAPPMDAGRAKILLLLNRLRADAEVEELVALLRQDPALTFKLLRYVNSPGMGLLTKVSALDQALMVLGRQKLYRWLTLLLFTGGETRPLDRALMENALVRARLSELLAERTLDATAREELFVAGVFSLLDVLMGKPMASILGQISLPPRVNDVLLRREGPFAPYLALAIACEQHADETIAALSNALGLAEKEVNNLHIDALVWAQEVAE
jgi:EAL and modified HD-GYP domain-containing signal transduction protein